LSSEAEAKLRKASEMLSAIAGDPSVPRNIRRLATQAKETLAKRGEEPSVRAAFAASLLEEASNDPNIPMHTRTSIWNLLSLLETVRE
jgi:uncharacterized protein (UPF0147 family)